MSATPEPERIQTPEQFRDWHLTREVVKYNVPFRVVTAAFERGLCLAALELEDGCRTKAAARLGMHRNTLQRYVDGLVPPGKSARRSREWRKERRA
jgi:DNA-binding NtrC family response regulator